MGGDSRRLWSLLDMVENFRINALRVIQTELHVLINLGDHNQRFIEDNGGYRNFELLAAPKHSQTLSKAISEVKSLTQMAETLFGDLNCVHINHAISSLRWWTEGHGQKWSDLKSRSVALRNAIDNELKEYLYYQYPKFKGQKLGSHETDWKLQSPLSQRSRSMQ
ncbi:MAG TPA: hypothetical protein VNC39_00010 [Acidocella sp.]|jgi:hypothetical protein|nr:hypothetical protein [Acidocella sp.]